MIGMKFKSLTVLSLDDEKNNKLKEERRKGLRTNAAVYYMCRCDCGNIISVSTAKLKTRKEFGCKDCKYIDFNKYIGSTINSWEILNVKKGNISFFECRCICGELKLVNAYNIINGSSKDCGCGRKNTIRLNSFRDIIGIKFGKLTPISVIGSNKFNKIMHECKCECGNTCNVITTYLVNGHTTSCGCLNSKINLCISQFLKEKNIKFIKEKFCRYNKKEYGRFDFYLPEYNLAIEYDGEAHYIPIDFAGKGEEWALDNLNKTKYRDKLKDKYCEDNNIKLLRIPYWEKENFKTIILDYIITLND